MANHVSGYMETYDENGDLVTVRRLKPYEKQAQMFAIPNAINQ